MKLRWFRRRHVESKYGNYVERIDDPVLQYFDDVMDEWVDVETVLEAKENEVGN